MSADEQDQSVDKTILEAEHAVQNNANDADLQVELGMAYFDADRLDEALAAFQHALALNPSSASAYNGMGRVRYHTGPPEAAIEAYEKAMSLDPQYIDPAFGLGILYSSKLGDYEKSLDAFERGLVHNPEDGLLAAFRGSTFARMGRLDEALTALQELVARQPNNGFAYDWLSILYLQRREIDKAMAVCVRRLESGDDHSSRRMLGYMHNHLGQHEEAIVQLERSLEIEPDDYEARAALSKVYRTVGRTKEADEHYARAHAMAMHDDEYGQSCFEAVLGNRDRALELLQVALAKKQVQPGWIRIDPEFAFINEDLRFKALIGD